MNEQKKATVRTEDNQAGAFLPKVKVGFNQGSANPRLGN